MTDLFSGLPDLVLEEIAQYLVPPDNAAWTQLSNEVFPLRRLTPRFNHFLTTALLKSVTLRLDSRKLEDLQVFLHFRLCVSPDYKTVRLDILRHSEAGRRGLRGNGSLRHLRAILQVNSLFGKAIEYCRRGLRELSITLSDSVGVGGIAPDTYSHKANLPLCLLSMPLLRVLTIKSNFTYEALPKLCALAPQLSKLHLEPLSLIDYLQYARGLPEMSKATRSRSCFSTNLLTTSHIVWMAWEMVTSGNFIQPLHFNLNMQPRDSGLVGGLKPIVEGIGLLRLTEFFGKIEKISVIGYEGMGGVDRDQITNAFKAALGGKANVVAIDWLEN